jgi:hypothetical protein
VLLLLFGLFRRQGTWLVLRKNGRGSLFIFCSELYIGLTNVGLAGEGERKAGAAAGRKLAGKNCG